MSKKDRGIISTSQSLIEVLPKVGIAVAFVFVFVGLTRGCQDENSTHTSVSISTSKQQIVKLTAEQPTYLVVLEPGEKSPLITAALGAKKVSWGKPSSCVGFSLNGGPLRIDCPEETRINGGALPEGSVGFHSFQFFAPEDKGATVTVCANFVSAVPHKDCM